MIMRKTIYALILVSLVTISCEKYEDYVEDYDFTIAYFNTQKPLRTVVSYDQMDFKVGVAMGGKRYNTVQETATFTIDPSLLDNDVLAGAEDFTLLPPSYYTLSDENTMVFPEGRYIGDVTVMLNRESFTADTLATTNTYALPIRVTETSLDSIASGTYDDEGNQIIAPKNFSIVVVKYISKYHGTYYHTGTQTETTFSGEINEVTYSTSDLIDNDLWKLNTINANTVETSGIGDFDDASLLITISSDDSVSLSTNSNDITELSGSGTYNPDENTISIDYSFTRDGNEYSVTEVLYQRRPPEEDLTFEEW
ncbi:MAG: hypothetical protein CL868_14260 [Cytophagaceae bacterium]|nr:hypothetical protein [Cytophagaceae bacterium]|tara:strand:- start:1163 stop:2092 length:930 start_codon:yes stop_codon:yes gene_type:complete